MFKFNSKKNNNSAKNSAEVPEKSPTNLFYQQLTFLKQPTIFLTQPGVWSRSILWTVVGITTFAIAGGFIFELETVISTQGKLEPKEGVKDVQANVACDVEEVLVKDGDNVEQGQVLVSCNKENSDAQLISLKQNLESLEQENELYRNVISSNTSNNYNYLNTNLPPEILGLLKERDNLVGENELNQVLLNVERTNNLTLEQQERLRTTKEELESRIKSQELQIEQLETQLQQIEIQLSNADNQVATAEDNLIIAEKSLEDEQDILNKLKTLVEEGSLSELQYKRQEQKVRETEGRVGTSKAEVETRKSEVNSLKEEKEKITSAIAQGKVNLNNTKAVDQKQLRDSIAANQQRIAQIDTQLNNKIIANDRQIAQLKSQISQLDKDLEDRNLKAPKAGTVFDLQVSPRSVVGSGQPVMKIVPDGELVAKVFITNQDRGKVQQGMPVDVRIDSYDFTEFGAIPGELVLIGEDALEPDTIHQYFRFPATIELQQQFIEKKGEKKELESGMSVNVNIKAGKRRIITIFISSLADVFDSLKQN